MSKSKGSNVVDDLIYHFRSSTLECIISSGVDKKTAKLIMSNLDKMNRDEYRYIHRILDKKKVK